MAKKNLLKTILGISIGALAITATVSLIQKLNKPGNEPSISFPIVDDSSSTSSDEQKEYELKIEAEDCVLGGEAQVKEYLYSLKAASGGKFVGGFSSNNTSSISFTISSNETTYPKIIICYGNRYDETDRTFDFKFSFQVNGLPLHSSTVFNNYSFKGDSNDAFDWEEYTIFDFNSGFELGEGENVITLRSNGPLSSNIDYFKIISTSEVIFNKAI